MHPVFFENTMLYSNYEMAKNSLLPLRALIQSTSHWCDDNAGLMGNDSMFNSQAKASFDLMERMTRRYEKPEFEITETEIDGQTHSVMQSRVAMKPFCKLLNFRKHPMVDQKKLLIVAPMSGHHATLLRGTVEGALPHFDVYVTDWIDARGVPISEGKFDLEDFISYIQDFIEIIGSDVNVMAVCQPTVPTLAAVSLLAAEKKKTPNSMILIGGPIDARKSPTSVNEFANTRTMGWFESNVITRVPCNYPGFMRQVYPGFVQLGGFMSMNMQRHIGEHVNLFNHLVVGDGESADKHKKFYNEYLSVMDMPAEFYLQTIEAVFKDFSLPRGKMTVKGKKVDPKAIKDCSLLCIEGELDDISGVGQTKAALDLCKNLPNNKKKYYMQKSVGHYGVFNGKKYREQVIPVIKDFVYGTKKK